MKNLFGITFLAAFLATGFCASSAFAQTSTSTESLILELQSQIKALQTRINELETELGVKPPQTETRASPAGEPFFYFRTPHIHHHPLSRLSW